MASSSAAGSSIGSKPDWDALLSSALNISAGADKEVGDMKLPWELPAFEDIFQPGEGMREDDMLMLQDPAWALSEQVSESLVDRAAKRQRVLTSTPDSALCFKVVRKSEGLTWQERRDNLLEKALSRWIYLISKWDEVCPDLPICHTIMSCTSVEKQKQVLCDWLHSKAPGTLLKRVNALLLFHRSMGWQVDIPYKEDVMYNYMSDSRAGGAKPSQLQSLREALIFVRHVLSMEQLEPFVKSRRCAGVVKGQRKQRRKAPPLKVPELRKLHRLLGDEHSQLWDRMFAGACLACAYMRARWGDFQQTVRFVVDRDGSGNPVYLEFQSDVFKTMNAKFWNDEPAIWVAPALGVSDRPWLDLWLEVRQELGIVSIEPPLPTPSVDGSPGEAGVSTAEIGAWLRLALPRDTEPLSAHSLKSLIERDMVPSYALVDLCSHVSDTNTVTWISPGKCTSRESEIQVSSKETARVFKLEDHQLKLGSETVELTADFSSAIMLQWCLQRRGLALDQVGLVTWEQHEHWVQHLLHSLTRASRSWCKQIGRPL